MKKLAEVQAVLKAPKGQFNSFGKYKYRSCEDILEAAKPICIEHGLVLTLSDEIISVGDRYYIKATAKVKDVESGEAEEVTAFAREEESKKGMDGSQITGTASSYARKYALNGLFCIDDTKDADIDEFTEKTKVQDDKKTVKPTNIDCNDLIMLAHKKGASVENLEKAIIKQYGHGMEFITKQEYDAIYKAYEGLPDRIKE